MPERIIDNLKITRRDLFTAGAGAGAALLLDNLVQPTPETKNGKELLNTILKLDPYSPERLLNEAAYVSQAESLDQIDQGFWVVSSKELRAVLLQKRHQLREKGELPDILSREEKWWAEDLNTHSEVLAICKENYPLAISVIDQLRSKLRPDLPVTTDPEQLLMNVGGMAMLVCQETGYDLGGQGINYGFAYVGEQPAVKQINPAIYPTGVKALELLCQNLILDTGLGFVPDKVPGSFRGSGDISGGAIGLQFMPDNALIVYNLLKETGVEFNPFDPSTSVIGAWVFLARREVLPDGDLRYGYFRNDPEQIEKALKKWNPKQLEFEAIYSAATSYYAKFLR